MAKYRLNVEEFNLIFGAFLDKTHDSTIPSDNKKLREILEEARRHKTIKIDLDFSNWNPSNPMFILEIGDD